MPLAAAVTETDTGTLILTSAVVAVVVSSIIGGLFTMWNDQLRRNHEMQLRNDDREHERSMQALTDRRAQRDRKAARIYGNLHAVVEVAVAVALQVFKLRTVPELYNQEAPEKQAALNKLKALQPAIRLDRETDMLYERVVQAVIDYNLWWVTLDTLERAREAGDDRLGQFTKDAVAQGDKL